MKYEYQIIAEFKLGELLPSVAELENELNGHMSDFGFDEKMFLKSTSPIATITSSVELSEEVLKEMLVLARVEYSKNPITAKFNLLEIKPV